MSEESVTAELFADYGPALVRWARAAARSEVDAEDAVQDAMVTILRAPHVLSVVERTGAWLYTLVRRRCTDIIRRDRTRRTTEQEAALEDLFEEGDDALDQMERQEVILAVAEAVKRLDEPLRFAFVENALNGKTFKEIAAESGIPMGTLMARKQKAVELVKNALRQRGLP
jgi:RNA polymerase sigma factor (sigma-70 family)